MHIFLRIRLLGSLTIALSSLAATTTQAAERPADFDTFWDAQLAALANVPPDPVLTPGKFPPEQIAPGIAYTQFSLAVGPGERVRGQIAHPDRPGEKFPALVIFQWAGVYPLTPYFVTTPAQQGWLAVNVFAHDQPIDEPVAFYEDLNAGPLKNYWTLGADDRERSYFRRMFLGTRRALDFVREHPAWDGQVLVVQGTSQGAALALVAAALDPAVTAVLANVPAFCDHHASLEGRAASFPHWLQHTEGRDPAAVARTARYYDIVHFAPRVTAPVLISAGTLDTVCPPGGIELAARALAGPCEFILMPGADHQGENNTHAPYNDRARIWMEALRAGQPAPLQPADLHITDPQPSAIKP
jgi:cephalosporin-C deacetylase-like acetyl esterase